MKMYEMEMKFNATVELVDMGDFLKTFDIPLKANLENVPIVLKQTVPFIPNDEYIEKVCNILIEKYKVKNFKVVDCVFDGYSKLIEVEIPDTN